VRIVDSLRPDKTGQARVFAADGSEFTAGQVLWMKGQLRKVAALCATGAAGDQAEATRLLAQVRELIRSHQRNS
jgi:ATP-dependent protease HslVU (ClpYQ) peptidase subunit